MSFKNWLRDLLHVHDYKQIKRKLLEVESSIPVLGYSSVSMGMKVLEKCSCGEYRAYLMNSSGDTRAKVPEILFPEEFTDALQ